jgi:hypothetical protein
MQVILFFIVMANITLPPSNNNVNHTGMSYTQLLLDRDNMVSHRSVFQYLIDKVSKSDVCNDNNKEALEMHGVSQDEINSIQQINNCVNAGKAKLITLLKEYDNCIKSIDTLNQKTKDIEDKLHQFQYLHSSLLEVDERFSTVISSTEELSNLKQLVIEDLETQLASTSIDKDRLEALIMSLCTTYNIIRTTPFVHICPICMTNSVDTFLDPCGHTICKECVSNKVCNSNKFCFMCRTPVRGIRPLYYS